MYVYWIPYFDVVFTVPHALHGFFRADRRLGFNLLFAAATEALQQLLEHGRRRDVARLIA